MVSAVGTTQVAAAVIVVLATTVTVLCIVMF